MKSQSQNLKGSWNSLFARSQEYAGAYDMKVLHGAHVEFGGVSWFSKKLITNLLGQNSLILVFYKTSENGGLGRSYGT